MHLPCCEQQNDWIQGETKHTFSTYTFPALYEQPIFCFKLIKTMGE